MNTSNEMPRRNRIDLFTPAEKAIYDAMQEVEKMAADTRLKEATILLDKARGKVADFIDEVNYDEYSTDNMINDIKIIVGDNHPYEAMVGLIKNVLNTSKGK